MNRIDSLSLVRDIKDSSLKTHSVDDFLSSLQSKVYELIELSLRRKNTLDRFLNAKDISIHLESRLGYSKLEVTFKYEYKENDNERKSRLSLESRDKNRRLNCIKEELDKMGYDVVLKQD